MLGDTGCRSAWGLSFLIVLIQRLVNCIVRVILCPLQASLIKKRLYIDIIHFLSVTGVYGPVVGISTCHHPNPSSILEHRPPVLVNKDPSNSSRALNLYP